MGRNGRIPFQKALDGPVHRVPPLQHHHVRRDAHVDHLRAFGHQLGHPLKRRLGQNAVLVAQNHHRFRLEFREFVPAAPAAHVVQIQLLQGVQRGVHDAVGHRLQQAQHRLWQAEHHLVSGQNAVLTRPGNEDEVADALRVAPGKLGGDGYAVGMPRQHKRPIHVAVAQNSHDVGQNAVHLVAVPRSGRTAVSAQIQGNHLVVDGELFNLVAPLAGTAAKAVDEEDGVQRPFRGNANVANPHVRLNLRFLAIKFQVKLHHALLSKILFK